MPSVAGSNQQDRFCRYNNTELCCKKSQLESWRLAVKQQYTATDQKSPVFSDQKERKQALGIHLFNGVLLGARSVV